MRKNVRKKIKALKKNYMKKYLLWLKDQDFEESIDQQGQSCH